MSKYKKLGEVYYIEYSPLEFYDKVMNSKDDVDISFNTKIGNKTYFYTCIGKRSLLYNDYSFKIMYKDELTKEFSTIIRKRKLDKIKSKITNG